MEEKNECIILTDEKKIKKFIFRREEVKIINDMKIVGYVNVENKDFKYKEKYILEVQTKINEDTGQNLHTMKLELLGAIEEKLSKKTYLKKVEKETKEFDFTKEIENFIISEVNKQINEKIELENDDTALFIIVKGCVFVFGKE
jgi:hypothetical protein